VTARRAGLVAGLVTVGLLAGCSGTDDEVCGAATSGCGPPWTPTVTDTGATTPATTPRAPSGTAVAPTTGLPETLSPSTGTGLPIPIPSVPQD